MEEKPIFRLIRTVVNNSKNKQYDRIVRFIFIALEAFN